MYKNINNYYFSRPNPGYAYANPYGMNFSRYYPRVVATANFANDPAVTEEDEVVINLPDGKKYTADDIRYLNKKRVFDTNTLGLIPSSLFGIPAAEMWTPLIAGNPMGYKRKGIRSALNAVGTMVNPSLYSIGANIVDANSYDTEKRNRIESGTDIPLPDKKDLDYMNAKLRYENSFVGKHPYLSSFVFGPGIDMFRGIQDRGRAWKYGLGSLIPGLALGGVTANALDPTMQDPVLVGAGMAAGMLPITTAGFGLYNARGKKLYEAEKAKRMAEGRLY